MLRSTMLNAHPIPGAGAVSRGRLCSMLLLTVLLGACDAQAVKQPAEDAAPARPVLVASAHYERIAQPRILAATIRPRIESDLGFRVSGKVARRLVQNGDLVRKGQALLVLDTTDFELQLEQAKAEVRAATQTVAQAEADEARTLKLNKDGWSPAAVLDKARAAAQEARSRLTRAQRAVELSENALKYATLEADADGVVTATPVERGQVVSAGQASVRLARLGELEALVALPEIFVERAASADGALTLWSLPGRSYEVKLRELSPVAEGLTRTYAARYTILNPDDAIRLGMSATLTLTEQDKERAVRLPLTAVFNHGRGPSVWVVGASGKLTARPVTIARYEGQSALIASGVSEGEKVVVLGVEKLDEGVAVRPTESLAF